MTHETIHELRRTVADRPSFAEFSVVVTACPVTTDDGLPVPAGSHGTIVAVYGDGAAYEVEFARPVVGNLTMPASSLRGA